MCGIVGGISKKNIIPILVDGLKRLEYRGYDSAGVVTLCKNNKLNRARAVGKVVNLEKCIKDKKTPLDGTIGIAHTRWATHGEPSSRNAHPHICNHAVSVVHNGIIENFLELKAEQEANGYTFTSDTDTEVIGHAIHQHLQDSESLLEATQKAILTFKGAYGIGVISPIDPGRIIATRSGSPLVIGISKQGNFIASDQMALLDVTKDFIYLLEGDIADITLDSVTIYDKDGKQVEREIKTSKLESGQVSKRGYDHYMLKEIFEQPQAIRDTLESRITKDTVLSSAFGHKAKDIFKNTKHIQIIACGTSYNAGLVAKYWLEDIAKIPTHIEVASEYRYRNPIILENTLFIAISQSGETADTLAALRHCKENGQTIGVIVNVPTSSMAREADLLLPTHAGPEIGVASTKAFSCQLAVLAALAAHMAVKKGLMSREEEQAVVGHLLEAPAALNAALDHDDDIASMAHLIAPARDVLYLGRGPDFPLAMEGALKLKEISYIHAEGYASGEMKHGPIALIDSEVPVIVLAPSGPLFEKTVSNMEEVRARGGQIVLISDAKGLEEAGEGCLATIEMPQVHPLIAPLVYAIPVQLLAYHVACVKGTDVDQPRNLAKSVTVE